MNVSHVSEWLRERICSGPKYRATMKFSEVQRMLLDGFGDTITPRDVKKALDIAFPGVVTERSTYINGIRLRTTPLVGPHAALAGPHAALAGPHAALADPHATLAGPHAALAENTSLKAENMSLKQERVRLCAQLDEVKCTATSANSSIGEI